ncbi:hypothetical protein, partial [Chryseobacterium sp. SIMBA_038]|uniref:hypothetical protein n=1 Tax=Chryseobacterium sp. SIMBA_038 TaxID=3085780 RepID=UPI00397C305E
PDDQGALGQEQDDVVVRADMESVEQCLVLVQGQGLRAAWHITRVVHIVGIASRVCIGPMVGNARR